MAIPMASLALLAALSGPQIERGTIGADIEYARHVERVPSGTNRESLVPFTGSNYWGRLWREVRQGHAVYHWRQRRFYLIHDFFCTSPASGATMPYSCEALAMLVRAAPPDEEGRVAEESLAELKGHFGSIEPHPTQPIFAALRPGWCDDQGGWCDEGAMVSVHEVSGRLLCARAVIPFLFASPDLWSELKVADGQLTCPDATRVRVPSWSEALRRLHAAGR